MQYKQSAPNPRTWLTKTYAFLFMTVPLLAAGQVTYIPRGAAENHFIEREEIRRGRDSILNFSKTKPYSRKFVAEALSPADSHIEITAFDDDKVDKYNAWHAAINNLEVLPAESRGDYSSKKTFLGRFYRTPATFFEVDQPDFFLAVNPVFQYTVGSESNSDEHLFLNTRGISVRGAIANKIGFYAYATDNQERDPAYVRQWEQQRRSVPGTGFYQQFKQNGFDYFDARGYVTFTIAKYINAQFGYDKNFIGSGERSLFLSDFSAPNLFLKLNTRIWKLNYQNLFMELNSANRLNADQYLPKKYAVMHHLDLGITPWLNVGLFEAVVFGRENHFEFGYLNPVIFYRSVEQQSGSFDNALVGLDAKANVAKRFQFYGQFLLDEFSLKELRKGSGWWANKIGYQLGAKYVDAFSIPHLDLQLESNRVRPFTYSHSDSVANYTHYNQPLAHPLGANLQEWIGVAKYQPFPKWQMEGKLVYYTQGKDTGSTSFGGNIFLPNLPPYRTMDYGYEVGSGIRSKTALASFLLSYEWKPDFYIEAHALWRRENETVLQPADKNFIFQLGVRWNAERRKFLF